MRNGMVKVVLQRAVKHNDPFIKDLARRQGTNHSYLIQVGRASHLWKIIMYWLIAQLYLYKFGIYIILKSFACSIIYFESYICIYIYFCLPLICSSHI